MQLVKLTDGKIQIPIIHFIQSLPNTHNLVISPSKVSIAHAVSINENPLRDIDIIVLTAIHAPGLLNNVLNDVSGNAI